MTQHKPHLLLVDDDLDLHELLGRYLSEQGFEITCVEDGPAMDRFLGAHSTDLIILDLMLPGENSGTEARIEIPPAPNADRNWGHEQE